MRRFKTDFRYLHVFVILFKQEDKWTSALRDMLEVFQSTFGPEFWRNVILEVTHWSYSPGMVGNKGGGDYPSTEILKISTEGAFTFLQRQTHLRFLRLSYFFFKCSCQSLRLSIYLITNSFVSLE